MKTGNDAVLDPVVRKISGINPADSPAGDTVGRRRLVTHVENALQRYQEILEHGVACRGLSTGFRRLDVMTNGLLPGMVYVIASRPSMGKTTLLLNILSRVGIEQQTPSMFFSGNLTISQIVDRLIFNRAMAPLCAFSNPGYLPNKADLLRIRKCAHDLAISGLVLDDSRDMTIEAIVAKAREERSRTGIGFIAIDHLHLIRSESTHPGTSRKREMTGVIRAIKILAQELELPILVSAQLKRRADGRLPRSRDIRESGAIENEADFVGLLHRVGSIKDQVCFNLLIAKNNNGPSGTVTLFLTREMQFEEGPRLHNEEEEMTRAWTDYRFEKDFPPEAD